MADATVHLSLPVGDLDEAREFYTSVLGCRLGRVRDSWLDVWFFGMQLTLQLRPDETRSAREQGVRHFGVVLDAQADYDALVRRIDASGAPWISPPRRHDASELSGKAGGKVSDPSGNVIEIKWYADPTEYRGGEDHRG
jgi:extradiol dioxygenase family protein